MPSLNVSPLAALAATQMLSASGSTSLNSGRDFGQELQRATQANNATTAAEPPPAPPAREAVKEPMREPAREPVRSREREQTPDDSADQAVEDESHKGASEATHSASEGAPGARKSPGMRAASAAEARKSEASSGAAPAALARDGDGLETGLIDEDTGLTGAKAAADALEGTLGNVASGNTGGIVTSAASAGAPAIDAESAVADERTGLASADPAVDAARTAPRAAGTRGPADLAKDAATGAHGATADFAAVQAELKTEGSEATAAATASLASQAVTASGTSPSATGSAWLVEQRGHAALVSATGHAGRGSEAAVATIDPAIGSAGFAPALGARISVLARDGIEQARLNVHPAELGPIALRLAIDGTQVRVDMAADWGATRQALEQSLPALAAALRDAGFTLAGGGVFQQTPQDRQAQQGQAGGPQANRADAMDSDGPGSTSVERILATRNPRGLVDLVA